MNNYYLIREKRYIFDNKWQAEKCISQCASFISTKYKDQDGYFGVLRGPYNATLGRAVQKRDVASHYYPKHEDWKFSNPQAQRSMFSKMNDKENKVL